MFGLSCRSVPATWWSMGSISRITHGWYGLECLIIELGQQLALRVTLFWPLEAVFFGCQDISPSVIEQILVSLKLPLLLF